MNTLQKLCAVFVLILLVIPVSAEEDVEEFDLGDIEIVDEWSPDNFARDERVINLFRGRTTRKGAWVFNVNHRAWESLDEEPIDNYLGLDSGSLKIVLGLRYGLLENLDVGIQRVNGTAENFDTYEFDARYQLLDQESGGVNLAVRGGVSWFAQTDEDDASGWFGQLSLDHTFNEWFTLGASAIYHEDSSSDRKMTTDDEESVGAGAMLEWYLTPRFAIAAEGFWNMSGYGEDEPVIATALKYRTHRHTFSLVISNTQYTLSDGLPAGAWRETDEMVIGFNITREF